MVRQKTKGEWVVREIKDVDENSVEIYFTASGKKQKRRSLLFTFL
jgi:hypothetical protein